MDISTWSISDYAAWWGAIIATLALVWNIIVALRSGPRIKVSANPNMKVYPRGPITEDNTYISVKAVNIGTAPTTITHFCGYHADSLWNLIRRKRQQFVITTHPALGNDIPHSLPPGAQWSSMADQSTMAEYSKGYLYLGVIHNQNEKPVYARVKLNA